MFYKQKSQPPASSRLSLLFIIIIVSINMQPLCAGETLSNFAGMEKTGRSVAFHTESGQTVRITPYGNYIVRVQYIRQNEDFFADERYEMVETHDWPGLFTVNEQSSQIQLTNAGENAISVIVKKNPLRLSFSQKSGQQEFLTEENGVVWNNDSITVSFKVDTSEHFAGLGHNYYARTEKLDLKGQIIQRNYGDMHSQQAPLIVPFFLSGKGYGVFLNSTFPNTFSFGNNNRYEFSIHGGGRMDYFVIAGPQPANVLDRYTQLTGRPRFLPKAALGLALSDKGHDHNSVTPSDENWWKQKITEHRKAGFPLDHVVNDNRWRAGGGKRCESFFEWDTVRYPDPREYQNWITANGLFTTLDFNRCIANHSDGWMSSYNIPESAKIEFKESAPDFTKEEVRNWFWGLFWKKSLNPNLHFPGDALWIDEFDEMGKAPLSLVLGNGMTWREIKNYWFFLIAKALVGEGWDKSFYRLKRPFVWVRGMTAGAQRFATLWSGDIKPTYADMKYQVRSMQAAGLSGFPYWGHDAGGFYDYEKKSGPDDNMYRQWSMAFGSFSPFWKPHGVGQSRWPLDRSAQAQSDAKRYSKLRYTLMPYIYTYAYQASHTGLPIARAMIFENPENPEAWNRDLQYMWGNEILVAPNCSDSNHVSVWLPEGRWYDFLTDSIFTGNKIYTYDAPIGIMPVFVKSGSIIPMAPFALSTAFIPKDSLIIHVYTGKDGSFTLYEDDGITEAYRNNQRQTTQIFFTQNEFSLMISPAEGTYTGAPVHRAWTVIFHGLEKPVCLIINGKQAHITINDQSPAMDSQLTWNSDEKNLILKTGKIPVKEPVSVKTLNCLDH